MFRYKFACTYIRLLFEVNIYFMVRNIPKSTALLILSFKHFWMMLMGNSFSKSKRIWTWFQPKSLKSTSVPFQCYKPYLQKTKWASRPSTRFTNLSISFCSLLKPINTRVTMLCTLASSFAQIWTRILWITWTPLTQTLCQTLWSSGRFTERQSCCSHSLRRAKSNDLVHFYLFLNRLSPLALNLFIR
jgi:hypothetical protein